jgi:hypothetical protein
VGKTKPAEVPIAGRVQKMKGKLLITESLHLLDYGSPKHLLSAHAMSAAILVMYMRGKVLPHHFRNDRVLIKDLADTQQFLGSWMFNGRDQQRHLILSFLAHFGATPFFVVVVFDDRNHFIATRQEICPPRNALFLSPYQSVTHFWMGTSISFQ